MADIKMLFHIDAPVEKVFKSLTTIEGLSNWWTTQTTGDTTVGGTIQFRFGDGGPDFKIVEVVENKSVVWEGSGGPDEWLSTIIRFDLDTNDGKTRVRFEHTGYKEADDFFANCSFSWGRYLDSLRQLHQTGKGKPFGSENY